MTHLSTQEMKVARQYLSPNVRLEVDSHLATGLPLTEPLAQLLRELLANHPTHKEMQHGKDRRTEARAREC